MGLKLYVSGAVKTQREAAAAVGVTAQSISNARRSLTGKSFEKGFDTEVTERSMSLSAVIAALSVKALDVMEEQITNGSSEDIRFKAAKDILDRNPETSKTNKIQMESFTLTGRDAKELAAALAEGRILQPMDMQAMTGDVVRVAEVAERPSIMGEVE